MIKTSICNICILFVCLVLFNYIFNNIMDENYTENKALQNRVWELENECRLF